MKKIEFFIINKNQAKFIIRDELKMTIAIYFNCK